MFMKIVDSHVHLARHVGRPAAGFFFAQAAEQDEEQVEAVDAGLFVVGPAVFELFDDLLKNVVVFQGGAAVDDVLLVLEAVLAQDVGDVAPGEVDPEDLRVVRAVIIVALFLPGAVDHHVAGGDDVFLAVKIKMSLSGRHIEQLEVHPAAGAVGRQLGQGHQAVGAAAAHEQRVFPVFKINS